MNESTTVAWLLKAVGQATRSANFCAADSLPDIDPGLHVEGLGAIKLPLKRSMTKKLVEICRVAPYGKGTQTLVNKKIRNTFELDPKKFSLNDAWNAAIADALHPVAEQLRLPADRLEARLYKLLVYEPGGFFLPHRDSEKHDRMVASMIVVLPNPFEGGTLVVQHGAIKLTLAFEEAMRGRAPCYAAFYADCEHEVRRVTSGVRLCVAYNLVLKPKRAKPPAAANRTAPADALAESISLWVAKQPAKPLVFTLEHHYTPRSLSLDLLKGADRELADLVVSATEKTDCLIHLAQVSRHLSQFADDGSFDRGYAYRGGAPRGDLEIGETYEDDLSGTQWTDVRGKKQPWGDIAFDLSAIVSSTPIDNWKPTSEEYEGYTGNAGNTLDRWYHRSAIVVWHRDHHFDVVASSGATDSIPLFCSMAKKLAKTPKKRLEEARRDCIRFARAILTRWPRHTFEYWHRDRETLPCDDFLQSLQAVHDRDTIAMVLSTLGENDQFVRLNSFVVAICREFGWSTFAPELKRLMSSPPNTSCRQEIPFRDVEWLSAFCCDTTVDADKSVLANELCAKAVERFCAPHPPQSMRASRRYGRETSASETSLPFLLKALASSGRDEDMSRVMHFVQESADDFSLDDCQVPCLISLIPWSQKRFGSAHPQLVLWLNSIRNNLQSATSERPAPPTDFARPADVNCNCQYCAQLRAFLSDPASEVGRIAAREDIRRHLINKIDEHQCDVNHALDRHGSPYSLKLTKTRGSFQRAVERFEANCRLLSALPVLE